MEFSSICNKIYNIGSYSVVETVAKFGDSQGRLLQKSNVPVHWLRKAHERLSQASGSGSLMLKKKDGSGHISDVVVSNTKLHAVLQGKVSH